MVSYILYQAYPEYSRAMIDKVSTEYRIAQTELEKAYGKVRQAAGTRAWGGIHY